MRKLACALTVLLSLAPIGCSNDSSDDTPLLKFPHIRPTMGDGIEVTTRTLDFGDVLLGTDRVLPLAISNRGQTQLYVNVIALTTETSPELQILSGPEAISLAPSATVTVSLIYVPDGIHASAGTLVVRSDDPDEPEILVSLSGRGVPRPMPEIEVAPTSLAFSDVSAGSSKALEVTVRNTGSATLGLTALAFDETTSLDFGLGLDARAAFVAPGAQVRFHVVYAPRDVGSDEGTLLLESNDFDEPVVQVTLSGNGVPAPVPEIEVSPTALEFAEVFTGTSASRDFTVTNAGTATLSLSSVRLGAGTTTEFTISSGPQTTSLAPGASATWTVTYAPVDTNSDSRTVQISSNDSDENVVVVSLSGTGVSEPLPEIDVLPAALDFGQVYVGTSSTLRLSVRNQGTATLHLTQIALDAGSSGEFEILSGAAGGSVLPGGSVSVDVRYTPAAAQDASGALRIESDDRDESILLVSLSGIGTPVPVPEIDIAPMSVDFGSVVVGGSATRSFTIRNVGTASLDVTSVGLTVGSSAEFEITSGGSSATLAPGASAVVQISYTPADVQASSGSVQVLSSDSDENVLSVSLAGTGVSEPVGGGSESVTLAWDPPTTNADGTPLDDLAGFRIYQGTASGDYSVVHDVGNVTTYVIDSLASGTYFFAVTAYDFTGNESDYSAELQVVVP